MTTSFLYKIKTNKRLQFLLVSRMIPISDLYEDAAKAYGKVVCPFHSDNDPSAKVYMDEDKIERMYCYSCDKQYTSWHYLKLVMGVDPMTFLRDHFEDEVLEEYAKLLYIAQDVSVIDTRKIPSFRELNEDINVFIEKVYIEVES